MNEPINIKDFYNHETRISIVENAILEIKETMNEIKSEIKEILEEKIALKVQNKIMDCGIDELAKINSLTRDQMIEKIKLSKD